MSVAGAPDFDAALLSKLEREIPQELRILRLRLRFGLPQTLLIGRHFRCVLELVDEMGQPVDLGEARRQEVEIRAVFEDLSTPPGSTEIELIIRDAPTRSSAQQERKICTWTFDAVFKCKSSQSIVPSNQCERQQDSFDSAALLFQLHRRDHGEETSSFKTILATRFHSSFQQFCAHSEWVDAATLVLPIRTQQLRLTTLDTVGDSPKTNVCTRLFSIPSLGVLGSAKLIEIQENYGDTMGSHVWDASILLSFALYMARSSRPISPIRPNAGMLELGAGCGLFGIVYFLLSEECGGEDARRRTLILTERTDSLSLLNENLKLNGIYRENAVLMPLVWGSPIAQDVPPVDAVFAGDVLYNWSAHEALLATIDMLHPNPTAQTPFPQSASVVIAHKHRGKATSAHIESVLQGKWDESCGVHCRWANWSVTRAARLGVIDVLVLTRKVGDAAPVT